MNTSELKEKFKSGMDTFFNKSKKALGKAGNAVQDFSDKSVIRIEKHQLESKKNEQITKLGQLAFDKFKSDDTAVLSASEESVVSILQEIAKIDEEIEKRADLLKKEEK